MPLTCCGSAIESDTLSRGVPVRIIIDPGMSTELLHIQMFSAAVRTRPLRVDRDIH
jgi:hypothetical protein